MGDTSCPKEKKVSWCPPGEQSPVCQLRPASRKRKPELGPLTVKAQTGLGY